MAQSDGYDGTQIKGFVENESVFGKYVDKTFNSLDTDHKGTLSQKQLQPLMGNLGGALGLPPVGSSKETDHIYDEVFADFSNETVSKATFKEVLKDVYLGLADGLQRDPISVEKVDGTVLREYAGTGKFDVDTVSTFTLLDDKAENRLQAIMLVDALKSIPVSKGMPPASDPKMKPLLRDGLAAAKVNTEDSLDQFQFVDTLKAVVLSIADSLQKSPVDVAHSEKIFDGEGIKSFLKDETAMHQALDETWNKLPKDKKGKLSNVYLRVGIDELSPAAGLPPVGAVDEMDSVLKTVFSKIDLDHLTTVNKEQFDKTMLEVLGSMMLQLSGKPVSISNSRVVDDSSETIASSTA